MLDETTLERVTEFMVTEGKDNRELLGYWYKVIESKNFKSIIERMQAMRRTKKDVKELFELAGLCDDYDEAIRQGRQEGRQEGRREGWEEGLLESKKSDARAMKAAGMDTNTIAQITGLTAREILSL
jgi:predicted transposase/invertase (TIGR01784 family)